MLKKVLIDTNILIDAAVPKRPQHDEALELVKLVRERRLRAWISAGSLKDAYYVICRHYGDERRAREVVKAFRNSFYLVELTGSIIDEALESDEPDFEDGIVRACAETQGCSAVVTRDGKGFTGGRCKKMTAADVAALFE